MYVQRKYIFWLFGIIVVFGTVQLLQSETFWEQRQKAYQRLKTEQKDSDTAPVKRSGGALYSLPRSSKEDFGIKKIKSFSSTKQFRNPYNITIPVEFGEIQDIKNNQGKPLIINIQDYHCHYQAQKQIAYILEELVVDAGLKLIMVEGNSKDASLKHLREMATRERRIEVGEDYLKRGMISGEEYLDIISEYDFKPLGIEDKTLYMSNLDSFLEIDVFMKDALKIIDEFKLVVENLKPKVYSKKIYEMDRKRKDCDSEKMSFYDYCAYLFDMAKERKVSLNYAHTNIDRVMKVHGMEKDINFDTVNKERDALIADLSKKLSDEDLARLLYKVAEFKNKRINAADFHNYLQQLPHRKWDTEYPAFTKYVNYLNVHNSIEVLPLFAELEQLEDAIKETLYDNDDERKLAKCVHNVEILYGFFALELIPDQYDYFKKHPEEFKVPEWQSFLDRMVRKHRLTKTVQQDISLITNKMDRVDNFYILAKQRDAVFVKKIKGYMEQENADIGVLITGGFHSTNLASMIYNAGYSFMTVLPTVTDVTDEELYHSVLKYKTDLLKKAGQQTE